MTIIGAGSLARTLLAGWDTGSTPFRAVTTVSRRASRAAELAPDVTRTFSIENDPGAIVAAVADADIVLIAVKPWMVHDLLPEIAPLLASGTVVVSVVAGVRLETLRTGLGTGPTIVRVLPNTPSQVNKGVAGLVGDGDPDAIELIRQLFRVL
ncbi:MAG: NAD(P)-binding domain-containing protein, partial [Microbacterium sp.]